MTTTKSAIRECRDQLFLDRAVDYYLSRVASNIGMDRPSFGFHDDSLWRAVVRRGALDYMQIANLFRDWLDVIIGPRITVSSVLSQDGAINDDFLMITDPQRLPQRGTVVLNQGLASAKTFYYPFLDPASGKMDIDGVLTAAITSVGTYAEGTLLSSYSAGATTLKLRASEITLFPTSGFPMTLLIGSGTANEEVVQLTAHAAPSNDLTVSATTKAHVGPTCSPITSRLTKVSAGGTVIFLSDTENFPNEGLLHIKKEGAATNEYIEYYDNDASQNMLSLRDKLVNSYTIPTVDVTLMVPGEKVQLAQVQVKGVGWEVFQTEARKIQIYLPRNIRPNRLIDASYLHNDYASMPLTTVAAPGASAGDKVLPVADASAFPMAGVIRINSGGGADERIGFARIDRYSTVLYPYLPSGGVGIPLGTIYLRVEDAREIYAAKNLSKALILSRGLGSQENVTWTSIDLSKNIITLSAATANNHASFDTCEVSTPNKIYLNTGLAFAHPAGHTVALEEDLYTATDLMIGDPTVAPANIRRFQGHYVYNPGDQARKNTASATTLAEDLAGPVSLLTDAQSGRTSLEITDAWLFESTGDFSVTIGRYRGVEETVETSAVVLKGPFNAGGFTVTNAPGAATVLVLSGGGALLPQPAAGAPYGYRLLVGTTLVSVLSVSGNSVTLESSYTVVGGEVVQMVSDVICLSGNLSYDHEGIIPVDQRLSLLPTNLRETDRVNLVEELRTYIKLTALTNFPTVLGTAIFNFGQNKTRAESKLTANYVAGNTVLSIKNSTPFPATGTFIVQIGSGLNLEQKPCSVTGANQITLTTGLDYARPTGTPIVYDPGDEQILEYSETATVPNRITFEDGIYLPMSLLRDIPVAVTAGESAPISTGTDYPLVLPASWEESLRYLFDRGRAAGVEVVIINDK